MYNCIIVVLCVLHLAMSMEQLFIEIDDEDLDIPEINKGLDLFEGDIMEEIKTKTRVARNAVLDRKKLWDIPVPYVFEDGLDMNAKGVILQAFEHFRLKTCIDFKPRQSEENYISVRKNPGCYSFVSKIIKNGQVVSIGRGCSSIAVVEHEFIHALGLSHEHSRYDRDDHITIIWENIKHRYRGNFKKLSPRIRTTLNAPYDYLSVMHYGKKVFSKNSADTIVTKLPQYQNIIGQRIEMSPIDVLKLNRLYNCNGTISFLKHCNFSSADICGMSYCKSGSAKGWKRMSSGDIDPDKTQGYFMHASTASGQEGDSAWLETKKMRPARECHVQCLQFYYHHSGSQSDQLNIWIREFRDERDSTGNLRLMGQITGEPTNDWMFNMVPLNASKPFQVVFEVRKGNEESSGGFSIDDINLSESECPHNVWQIKDFERLLTSADFGSYLFSPRMYSTEGEHDSTLKWPCPWRQISIIMLDKNPHIQQQMSRQISVTTDPSSTVFDNPRLVGRRIRRNGESLFVNPAYGVRSFLSLEQVRSRDFLRGGTAVFLLSVTDISSLQNNSSLPCPKLPPSKFTTTYPDNYNKGPCNPQGST